MTSILSSPRIPGPPLKWAVCVLLGWLAVVSTGCQTPDTQRTSHMITIHALASRSDQGTGFERVLPMPDGDDLMIRSMPAISPVDIKEIKEARGPKGEARATAVLTRHGEFNWQHACGTHPGEWLVIAVDGQFHHFIEAPSPGGAGATIDLGGPWEEETLKQVIEWAPKNHEHTRSH